MGSLYREKRVDDLIVAYSEVRDELGHDIPHVDIVGDGQDMPRLRQLVSELKLDPLVTFHGAVFDEQSLGAYLRKAIVCVSPGQAGLSVLKAMSFGVCFVTSREAITGGEILNIRDGVTGVLLSDKQHLTSVLREAADEPARLLEIGKSAKHYYDTQRTPKHMSDGIAKAIDYAWGKRGR